jgi:hypothetical protein
MRYNRQQLKQDIKSNIQVTRAIKARMHEPFQPHFTWQDRRDLGKLKDQATTLHACAAHLRHKIHLSNWLPSEGPRRPMSMEEQQDLIKESLSKYIIVEQAAEVAA